MAAPRLQPLELGRLQVRTSRGQHVAGAIMAVVLVVAVAAVMYPLFAEGFGDLGAARLRELAGTFAQKIRQAPAGALFDMAQLVLVVAGACIGIWYTRRSQIHERLLLDETGLRYRSPLPERLRFLQPDWSLPWSQVRSARIIVPRWAIHPAVATLELDAGGAKRKVPHVVLWSALAPAAETAAAPWRRSFFSSGVDREKLVRAVEESTLVRYVKQAGVAVRIEAKGGVGYALENHRSAMTAAIAVLLLLGYAVIDLALNKEEYAADAPVAVFALGGAAVALASALWLARRGVPRAEAIGLSLLLGGAAAFALYPGLLRVNQATDQEGLRSYEYRMTGYVAFSPSDPRLPELRFTQYGDYWGQFKLGTVQSFELRKGALGFYQVDMGPVYAGMREYFVRQR